MIGRRHRHRAEVIETYPSEGRAAVRFKWRGRDRVECVRLSLGPSGGELAVGQKGYAEYWVNVNMGFWGFSPFKKGGAA